MWSAFANINWKAMLIPLAVGSAVVGVIVLLMLLERLSYTLSLCRSRTHLRLLGNA